MRFFLLLAAAILAPITGLAAPVTDPFVSDLAPYYGALHRRDNLCNLKEPPVLCQPNASVTVAETAERAYQFYLAFVVDGDPRTMFSYIDSVYKQNHPGYASGPDTIWPLFCSGTKLGTLQNTSWCFEASTNMSYAHYSTTDQWLWVDGCVHEHWDQDITMPTENCYVLNSTDTS